MVWVTKYKLFKSGEARKKDFKADDPRIRISLLTEALIVGVIIGASPTRETHGGRHRGTHESRQSHGREKDGRETFLDTGRGVFNRRCSLGLRATGFQQLAFS